MVLQKGIYGYQTNAPTFPTGIERTPRMPLGKKLLEIRQKIVASGRLLLTLVTTERPTTALFRVVGITVTTIGPLIRM